jgi:hypothetical protein
MSTLAAASTPRAIAEMGRLDYLAILVGSATAFLIAAIYYCSIP